jgi:phosphoribosylformylglycinamidine (FGAM) synthase-like amidotransferase family enzyme
MVRDARHVRTSCADVVCGGFSCADVVCGGFRESAEHFRAGDVSRACGHLLATEGELIAVRRGLDTRAGAHAARFDA